MAEINKGAQAQKSKMKKEEEEMLERTMKRLNEWFADLFYDIFVAERGAGRKRMCGGEWGNTLPEGCVSCEHYGCSLCRIVKLGKKIEQLLAHNSEEDLKCFMDNYYKEG